MGLARHATEVLGWWEQIERIGEGEGMERWRGAKEDGAGWGM